MTEPTGRRTVPSPAPSCAGPAATMDPGRDRARDRSWEYRGPFDLRTMQELAHRLWRPGARWHLGDLAWGRYQHTGREGGWRTRIWADGDTPTAWAWLVEPGELDLLVDPARPDLLPAVVDWFEAAARAGRRTVTSTGTDTALAGLLTARGYRQEPDGAPHAVHLVRDLTDLPAPRLPHRYRLGYASEAHLGRRVAAHREAFEPSAVTVGSYRQVRSAWPYREDLDVVVETADGDVVAYCLAWYDEAARVGLLEPVGTRRAHRRNGLATAACAEALRRLRAAGATTATISARGDAAHPGPIRVYEALGFRRITRDRTYVHGGKPLASE